MEQHRQEQSTEQAIKVRRVTDVHANWSAQERGEHGKFSYQLILDDGAAEYVLRVTADDAKVLRTGSKTLTPSTLTWSVKFSSLAR